MAPPDKDGDEVDLEKRMSEAADYAIVSGIGREVQDVGLDFTIGIMAEQIKGTRHCIEGLKNCADEAKGREKAGLMVDLSRARRDLVNATKELSKMIQANTSYKRRKGPRAISAAPGQAIFPAPNVHPMLPPPTEPPKAALP